MPRLAIISAFALLGLCACHTGAIRPKVQAFTADVEFDPDVKGGKRFDVETDFAMVGLEVAFPLDELADWYFDVAWAQVEADDFSVEMDGLDLGIGLRAAHPTESGPGVDFDCRFSSLYVEDETRGFEQEFYGSGLDGQLGGRYAFVTEEGFVIAPAAGGFFRYREGELETDLIDFDWELASIGVYAGLKMNSAELTGVDFIGNVYAGTDSLTGFMIAVGGRF